MNRGLTDAHLFFNMSCHMHKTLINSQNQSGTIKIVRMRTKAKTVQHNRLALTQTFVVRSLKTKKRTMQ